jgi:hypothetical protein
MIHPGSKDMVPDLRTDAIDAPAQSNLYCRTVALAIWFETPRSSS